MITINLDDLTQAHIDEAAPHIGKCTYSAPCIIGALMTPKEREAADKPRVGCRASPMINSLVDDHRVRLADPDQLQELSDLQYAFDTGNITMLTRRLAKRGLTWPTI